MKCLIDADTVAFACAASAEDVECSFGIARAYTLVESILAATKATSFELWLSGPTNFRYSVYPEYKANRLNGYRPKWEKEVKQYLVDEWGAQWSNNCEADDMVGVKQCTSEEPTIIAHIDKDINMIPGEHYSWEISRLGKVVRPATLYTVKDEDALRFFYYQLIVGDKGTDNIPGVRGYGPKKADAILAECADEASMYKATRDLYASLEEMEMNARCLWIWRKMGDEVTDRWRGFEYG
jgi:5'-3' exonuclease